MKPIRIFKRNLLIVPILAAVPFIFSCKDKAPEEVTPTQAPIESSLETTKAAFQNAAPTTNQAASTASGLNPAHGQPGHRCDIKVGAPLNSAAGATNATPINTSTPAAVNTGGSGMINPAHGQPGHRCDVKVGDPL